jgi:uncharacterized protein (DUF433 family)
MAIVPIEHIDVDEKGLARIVGTDRKVLEVAADYLATGSPPERLHSRFHDLTLPQVLTALAYYFEHRTELDAQLHDPSTADGGAELSVRAVAVNRLAWLSMVARLRREHRGKCGAIADGRLLGITETLQEAERLIENQANCPGQGMTFFVDQDPVFEPYYDTFSEYL